MQDIKQAAAKLAAHFQQRGIAVSHAQCLEALSKALGARSGQALRARHHRGAAASGHRPAPAPDSACIGMLALAATGLRDLYLGWPAQEVVGSTGSGLGTLLRDVVCYLREQGVDDAGAWDCDVTGDIAVAGAQAPGGWTELNAAARDLVDSADPAGGSDDRTEVSAEAAKRLRQALCVRHRGARPSYVTDLGPGVRVRVQARGSAVLESSQLREHLAGDSQESMADEDRGRLDGAVDALEFFLLALAAEGVDIGSHAVRAAFHTAVENVGNRLV